MMKEKILKLLGRKDYVPANIPELLLLLRLEVRQEQELQRQLSQLDRSGHIARIKGNRFIIPQEADLIPGRIQITRGGRGFLTPDDPTMKEIGIAAEATGTALHEDHVLVRLDVRPKRRSADTEARSGKVVRVLERRRVQIVGTLRRSKQFLHVTPDDPRLQHDITVPEPKDLGRPARVGDKVVVELREWESRHSSPEGVITEVLGPPTDEGVDMLGILRHYNMPLKFPAKVLQEVRRIGDQVTPKDLADRTDCRGHAVITIDPDDAKDFDDAFHLAAAPDDCWKLWVHIADVSHYVKPGSALDVEARKRGNSSYLVDRVIPMLPEALSNELCSLKPEVDRLTKCVEFLVSGDGQILKSHFYPAVIHSQRRYSYQEALKVIESTPGDPIEEMLCSAHRLAQRIRRHRFRNGSLELDFPENKIRLDEQGKVLRIDRMENDVSHQLIEEFMLLANEAVAGQLMKKRRASIYRVHEEPEAKRLEEYRQEVLSHNVPCGNLSRPGEVQKLLRRLTGMAIGPALKIGFLKSLMRARYAVEPLGHYGLAKKKYTHFTSPIRRYADLVVHRSLFATQAVSGEAMVEVADHISRTERNSADAERDSKDVKLYAFLNEQLKSAEPNRYAALVTDLRNFGFFVDVTDLGMSGLIPLSILEDDFYIYDPNANIIIGRRTRRIIRLGDIVEVQIAKVDDAKKRVDFRLVPGAGGKRKRSGGRPPSSKKKGRPQSNAGPERRGKKKATAKPGSDTRSSAESGQSSGSTSKPGSKPKSGSRSRSRSRSKSRSNSNSSENAKTNANSSPNPAPKSSGDAPSTDASAKPRRRRRRR
jgi:ribonuclease R